MFEKLKGSPYRIARTYSLIFVIYFFVHSLFKFRILPSFSLTIADIELPAFQTTQILLVFPIILIIIYIFFVRKGILKWHELGFNKGKNGLLFTVSLGLLGGLVIGIFNYLVINHFILQEQVIANFIEKCLFTPIWEEFFNRVLFLTILEISILGLATKYFFENPKYKDKITGFSKKVDILAIYSIIIFINSMWFVWWHNVWQSGIILLAGSITGIVYLKTRSIIAPIIVHSMSNLVTGGFIFLIIHHFF